ncbi:uncharacterized protein [Haliotis asinina]|uniref:uncharacterized protein n=1 Tax=Haliotis asinina TaxID=109174 RepID=UPI0035327468
MSNYGDIAFLIWGIVKLVHCDSCFDVATVIQRDKYMEHQAFRKFWSPSLYTCASECLMSSGCLSFGFDEKTRTCLLNDKDNANGNVVERTGFLFSDILHWPKSFAGPCSPMACQGTDRCQVDRLHRATCVPEFKGCGQPPEVTGASKTYEGHDQGAVTTYTCKQDFTACHDKVTSICQSSGHWENMTTGLCTRNIWHSPTLGSLYPLPCGPSSKFTATVIGTPIYAASQHRWNIWLWKDTDVLLISEFRFQFDTYVNTTVMNSRIGGSWLVPTRTPSLPMLVGQETEVRITLHSGIYRLQIDGQNMINYTEKVPGAGPVSISVEGHVSLRMIEIVLY